MYVLVLCHNFCFFTHYPRMSFNVFFFSVKMLTSSALTTCLSTIVKGARGSSSSTVAFLRSHIVVETKIMAYYYYCMSVGKRVLEAAFSEAVADHAWKEENALKIDASFPSEYKGVFCTELVKKYGGSERLVEKLKIQNNVENRSVTNFVFLFFGPNLTRTLVWYYSHA